MSREIMTQRLLPKAKSIPGITGWAWAVFFIVLVTELIAAYIVVYQRYSTMTDAMARTANAYYVLYLLPSKLASIGFVWNPLPSLLQIPILLFTELWRPLATHGFAGSIITSIFAGVNASLLFRYFRISGSRVWLCLLIAFLYAFNPFIFFYGFNGMSETLFFTVPIAGIYNFAMWTEDRSTNRLLVTGLMLAIGWLVRYEVLPLILAFALSLLVAIYLMKDKVSPFKNKSPKMKREYTVATFLVLFLPVAYAIAIWMIVCWVIMGDPFYFSSSEYSNESFTALWVSHYNAFNAVPYIALQSLPFIPPFAVIVCERIATRRLIKADMLIFIFFSGCFVGFHYVMLVSGKSFGWLRFYSYIMPVCMAWLPYEMFKLRKWARALTAAGLCIGLAVSAALMPVYFANVDMGAEEYFVFHGEGGGGNSPLQMEIARELNQKYSDATVLMDSFSTSTIILNLEHPEKIVTNTSDNFEESLKDPRGYGIDYIVTIVPRDVGLLDMVNREYPDLFYYGVPSWAELVMGNESYRLYRVLPADEAEDDGTVESEP